ncbi:hypothetical protein MHM39_16250 [Phaeobacter sp. CNT1-3]|nr:hypothetical protein [Phaeobacter sp. CNT1-3]
MRALLPRTFAVAALASMGLTGASDANENLGARPETDPNSEIAAPVLPLDVRAPPLVISVEGPLDIQAPPLVLNVEGPLEIDTPPLVLAIEGPLEINAPDLVLAVEGPLILDAPALVITAYDPFVVTAPALLLIVEDDKGTDRNDKIAEASVPPTPNVGSTLPRDSVEPRLCVGTYKMFMKQAVGSSISHAMPVGTKEVARATVSTENCGAFLTLESQGQKILLARQHGDKNVYQGELHVPDGAKRVMTLTCGQNLTLYGGIVARDDRAQVSRQLWLQLDRVNEAVLASCAEAK